MLALPNQGVGKERYGTAFATEQHLTLEAFQELDFGDQNTEVALKRLLGSGTSKFIELCDAVEAADWSVLNGMEVESVDRKGRVDGLADVLAC